MASDDSSSVISPAEQRCYGSAGKGTDSSSEPVEAAGIRRGGLLVGLGCLGVLVAAWHLEGSYLPFGRGSQIVLPSCFLQESTGYPCLTCGMTRAWACSVRGDFVGGVRANVAGTFFAVACGLAVLGGFGTALAGESFYRRFVRPVVSILRGGRWVWAGVGLVVLAWVWNMFWAFAREG